MRTHLQTRLAKQWLFFDICLATRKDQTLNFLLAFVLNPIRFDSMLPIRFQIKLWHFKLAITNEINAVNRRHILSVDLLVSYKVLGFHIIRDFLNNSSSKLAEHSELLQKVNLVLQLSFLHAANYIMEVSSVKSCKRTIAAADDGCRTIFILQ